MKVLGIRRITTPISIGSAGVSRIASTSGGARGAQASGTLLTVYKLAAVCNGRFVPRSFVQSTSPALHITTVVIMPNVCVEPRATEGRRRPLPNLRRRVHGV